MAAIQGPVLGVGEARIGIEMVASPKITSEFSASYLYKGPLFPLFITSSGALPQDLEFPGYRFQGQVKYYWLKFYNDKELSTVMLPSGFYVSLHSSYTSATMKLKGSTYPQQIFTLFNINALGGMQVMYKDHIGFDIFGGLGYKNNVIALYDYRGVKSIIDPVKYGHLPYYTNPIKISFGFNLTFGLF